MSSDQNQIKKIENFTAGDRCAFTLKVTEDLVSKFAELTGDFNPLHVDQDFARKTSFQKPVAHGMIAAAHISTLIGMYLPGPGALWISQEFEFLLPVRIGDTLEINGEVASISKGQGLLILAVNAKNQNGATVLAGKGKVKLLELLPEERMIKSMDKSSKILITGGSQGLGAETALLFAHSGATVFTTYFTNEAKMNGILDQATSLEGKIIPIQADLTTQSGIDDILAQTNGKIDILVFNAVGKFKNAPFLEQSIEDFEKGLDFGMRAPYHLLKAYLPNMIEQRYGRIVSILSTAIVGNPYQGYSSYCVNKRSLESITKSIAVEYGKYNITANMVSPSMLRTQLTEDISERAKKLLEATTPLRRLAELDEVASAIEYLCSEGAGYLNGHNMVLSGGETIV